jgi:pyruvate dehydrogenase E2 component (dihydrolipoamide acetyltransferase)
MAIEITIPRLGWSMEEGTFVQWTKQAGDTVQAGEPLFVVESDKVTMDVESLDSGILYLTADAPTEGALVKPGQLIGYLLAAGEVPPAATPRIPVTPRARRVAKELGLDTAQVKGSGRGGRIREQDVRAAAPAPSAATAPAPVSAIRRTIAERMTESHQQTVPVTLMRRVDASRFTALRNRWKLRLQPAPAPAIHDIVAKITAIALKEFPMLARPGADGTHLGIAVDTDRGLLVPVVRNVQDLTLPDLAYRSRELIQAVRRREVKAEDLQGGVFSISNLGGFGVEAFTPVINYPETAILGLGAIRWEPVVLPSGQIVAREQMTLSLTFDHRVVDGAPAARFLAALAGLIEEPPPEVHCP